MSAMLEYLCPTCQMPSGMVIGPEQAICTNDDCRVIAWNPTKTMDEMLDDIQIVNLDFGQREES